MRKSFLFAIGNLAGGLLAISVWPEAQSIERATYTLVVAVCVVLVFGKDNA